MMYIREHKPHATRLSDHLPWASLIGPGLVLNKDGSFQKSFGFRGPDLASASDSQLIAFRSQLNNALKRLGSRWCIHVEALREPSQSYPVSAFPDKVSALVDAERRRSFEAERAYFETSYFITFTYLPPEDQISRATNLFLSDLPEAQGRDTLYRSALADFTSTVAQVADILSASMPFMSELNDEETLTYLHRCISSKSHTVSPPDIPALLDGQLTDDDFEGGLYPRLGGEHLQTLSIRAYPSSSFPGLLDQLNALGAPYRWVCRFLPLDKEDARRALISIRRRWFAKRKGVVGLFKEAVTREPALLEDSDALAKTEDTDAALSILGGDAAAMGYFTPTITVIDKDPGRLATRVRDIEACINRAGFVAKVETLNGVEAWLGSLPGHAYADCRRPMISTLNLCDMLPATAIWAGPRLNRHLTLESRRRGHKGDQPPVIYAKTAGSTPFRLSLHQGDVGHTLVIGPTGSGKSVLLSILALQWLRYPDAQVFFFDKGRSARAATLLVGGAYFELGGNDSGPSFQPLAGVDDPQEMAWAQEWMQDLMGAEGVLMTPERKHEIWAALANLAASPRSQRTLTVFAATVQDQQAKSALRPYTIGGPYGRILDAEDDFSSASNWQTFEMQHMLDARSSLPVVLCYMFHYLERRLDGRPTLLVLDEAWLFLDNSTFAARIRGWLKTLRKLNVSVVFATQSLADVAASSIAPALIESCPTRILLPNADAETPQIASFYRGFGLSDQQIRIIRQAAPKREYYYQSSGGDRLFELGLGPIALCVAAASSASDQLRLDALLEKHGPSDFAEAYFGSFGPQPQTTVMGSLQS